MEFQFINPENIPPEILESIRRHHDMHEMGAADFAHRRQELFDNLGEEQLKTLRVLLSMVGEGSTGSAFLAGYITGQLYFKHDICACGERHDFSQVDTAAPPTKMPSEQESDDEEAPMELDEIVRIADLNKTWLTDTPDLLEKYGLEVRTRMTGVSSGASYNVDVPPHLICSGCEVPVASLQDRMLRDPGVKGCPTCQDKAKWG